MYIGGAGITPFEAKIKWNFKPETKHAIEWFQIEDGNYRGIDRTAEEDVYESDIIIYGTESVINTFIDNIELNRVDDNIIYLYGLTTGEYIFGANVAPTSMSVPVAGTQTAYKCTLKMSGRYQGTLKGFGVSLTVRNLSPSFTGSASLPLLKAKVGYTGESDYTIGKQFTYDGTAKYTDNSYDAGIFEGTFTLSNADMASMRQYIRSNRASTISLVSTASSGLVGVAKPFGRRSGSYPYNVKILDFEDLGPYDTACKNWNIRIKFAEVI